MNYPDNGQRGSHTGICGTTIVTSSDIKAIEFKQLERLRADSIAAHIEGKLDSPRTKHLMSKSASSVNTAKHNTDSDLPAGAAKQGVLIVTRQIDPQYEAKVRPPRCDACMHMALHRTDMEVFCIGFSACLYGALTNSYPLPTATAYSHSTVAGVITSTRRS